MASNPADALDSLPIDGYRYDYARHCTKSPTPGALALKSGTSTPTPSPAAARRTA